EPRTVLDRVRGRPDRRQMGRGSCVPLHPVRLRAALLDVRPVSRQAHLMLGGLALQTAVALMWATVRWDWGLVSGGGILSALFFVVAGSTLRQVWGSLETRTDPGG